MARDFTRIRAWDLAHELTVMVYDVSRKFPGREIYGITSQLRRAAISVPSNIAEGANRAGKREYLQFLSIASGSLAEEKYLLCLSMDLGYLDKTQYAEITLKAEEASKALSGLAAAVRAEV